MIHEFSGQASETPPNPAPPTEAPEPPAAEPDPRDELSAEDLDAVISGFRQAAQNSKARWRANAENAARSTGPTSEAGKNRSKMNGLRHGLRARQLVIDGELEDDFESFAEALRRALAPADGLEEILVEQVVAASWRLRRCLRVECGLFAADANNKSVFPTKGTVAIADDAARTIAGDVTGPAVDRVLRYAVTAERSFHRALVALERVQARRRGEPVPAPAVAALDVTLTAR